MDVRAHPEALAGGDQAVQLAMENLNVFKEEGAATVGEVAEFFAGLGALAEEKEGVAPPGDLERKIQEALDDIQSEQ